MAVSGERKRVRLTAVLDGVFARPQLACDRKNLFWRDLNDQVRCVDRDRAKLGAQALEEAKVPPRNEPVATPVDVRERVGACLELGPHVNHGDGLEAAGQNCVSDGLQGLGKKGA